MITAADFQKWLSVFKVTSGGGGSGIVNNGTINQLAWYAATGAAVSGLPTANNGVLRTDGSGVPSISTTLPNGLAMGTPASINLNNGTNLPRSGLSGLGTGVAAAMGVAIGAANSFAVRDANSNLRVNNLINGFASTVTAAGTLTLTATSAGTQQLTGSATHTVEMPVTSTLVQGLTYEIINSSSEIVTVNSSGGDLIQSMESNTKLLVTCILTSGTSEASWNVQYYVYPGNLPTIPQVQSSVFNLGVDSGTADNYVITMNPPITAYTQGLLINFPALNSNTGNSTINIDGVGVVSILNSAGAILSPNDINIINDDVFLYCTGTAFTLLNSSNGVVTGATLQSSQYTFGADNGSADDYMVSVSPNGFSSYTDGMTLSFIPLEGNATSSPQVSFNGLSSVPIRRSLGTACLILDLNPNQLAEVTYSSPTNFFILKTPAN